MDIFTAFASDEAKETDGVWVEIGDSQFLVARSGNTHYSKKLTNDYERSKKLLERKDDAADKLSEKLMIGVMAKTLLLDWKGVMFKGEPLPYSYDNAVMLLSLKDFRKQISQFADDFNAYKAVQDEDLAKNS